VGIDLELAKKILAVTGPVLLTDFNQEVNAQNMYEKVQYEVESDFFPGSRKKANFLTSLSRVLLARLTHAEKKEYLALGKVLYESLRERHLQVFLHDTPAAKALMSVGWDGGVTPLACSIKNCQSLLLGGVEANVGVNKANYFIKREADYNLSFVGNQVVVRQTITLVNIANPALGLAGKYKAYLRAVAPVSATFENVEISDSQGIKYQEVDYSRLGSRSEAGVLVDVSPGAKKKITFTYKLPLTVSFTIPGEIQLMVRKQAGIEGDLFKGRVKFPRVVNLFGWGSLTPRGEASYNTSLREDIKARFSW
jgi:hypothetical protein